MNSVKLALRLRSVEIAMCMHTISKQHMQHMYMFYTQHMTEAQHKYFSGIFAMRSSSLMPHLES